VVTLEKLGEQEMISSLLNESKDPSSNNKMIEVSIPPINFNKDEYEPFSIFIHQCPNILALTEVNESDINKEFINFKQRFPWTL
jgi:RNA recognition motif-containing protein